MKASAPIVNADKYQKLAIEYNDLVDHFTI